MTHVPLHKFAQHGDITAVHWIGAITSPDLPWVLERMANAQGRAGGRVLCFSLIGKQSELPSPEIRDKMAELQPRLSEFQTSSHLIITKPGMRPLTGVLSLMAYFSRGTGGMMFYHKRLIDGLSKAASLGHLSRPPEEVITWLKSVGFPTD